MLLKRSFHKHKLHFAPKQAESEIGAHEPKAKEEEGCYHNLGNSQGPQKQENCF